MIPEELKRYPQWVCWRSIPSGTQKPTKLPYCPLTGRLASSTNPQTWSEYKLAVAAATNGYSGVGFVLSDSDPYCFIDLDDPAGDPVTIANHNIILNAVDSYAEVSPSGAGIHIIARGSVPQGRRKGKVEIYSAERYMTMTGQTFRDRPIADCSDYIQQLWASMGSGPIELTTAVNQQQAVSDGEIFDIAINADNADKFKALWEGDWNRYYPSQSEADYALIDILGFYSRNSEQIQRMFLQSGLGQRQKAKRKDYLAKMVQRSFDNQAPDIPFDQIKASVKAELTRKQMTRDEVEPINPFAGPLFENVPDANTQHTWTKPPGLIGEIATFIFEAAPRPVQEIALAAAIGLMAGICGRAYNISGTGLNQYILVLAKTGIGKEAAGTGISRLMQAVRVKTPSAMDFIGPAEIASGPALVKYLAKNPCFVSQVGEFGLALQAMCAANATAPQLSLRKILLALYNKSGSTDILQPTIYSDKEKNTQAINSPAFSILGESTPQTYYPALDELMIAQGLLPRFTVIEYHGGRPKLNANHRFAQPSEQLVTQLADLCTNCLVLAHEGKVLNVELDEEATKIANEFNEECDNYINGSEFEVARQLWNRAHIKALKLSALLAIGLHQYQPVISRECIQWAITLVTRDINNILHQFDSGKAGRETGELNQISELRRTIREYLNRGYGGLERYQVPEAMHRDCVVPLSYIQRRLIAVTAFKNDRIGATGAIKRTMEMLRAEGAVRQLRDTDVYQRYRCTMAAYVVLDIKRFNI